MAEVARLTFRGQNYELPVVEGSEHELGLDISKLRAQSGLITLDEGYSNTGSCLGRVTFIDGEKGILRYRGYPIEDLAQSCTFVETAYLVITGELPDQTELERFRGYLQKHRFIHEDMRYHFEGFPSNAHPMAILSAMINAISCFQPGLMEIEDDSHFLETAARLMSKVRTIAAYSYKKSTGEPYVYPRPDLRYTPNFLHMLFSKPNDYFEPDPVVTKAMDQIFLLHADHEQNCSTATVRMVASGGANIYASVAAGVCALWGARHGGANTAAVKMLMQIHESGQSIEALIEQVKRPGSGVRLMGFGHRVYKNFDPRARIIKEACDRLLDKLGIQDPLLDIAKQLEEVALRDEYFIERKPVSERGLLQRDRHASDRHSAEDVPGDVRDRADAGLDRQLARSARKPGEHLPPAADLQRTGAA